MAKMIISKDYTIADLKRQFSAKFSHLKLEFYGHPHDIGKGSESADQLDAGTPLTQINPKLPVGEIVLDEQMTVKDFESLLEKEYGLHAQVFRKSAELWLQTSSTDHWTLEKQDGKGGRSEAYAS